MPLGAYLWYRQIKAQQNALEAGEPEDEELDAGEAQGEAPELP